MAKLAALSPRNLNQMEQTRQVMAKLAALDSQV